MTKEKIENKLLGNKTKPIFLVVEGKILSVTAKLISDNTLAYKEVNQDNIMKITNKSIIETNNVDIALITDILLFEEIKEIAKTIDSHTERIERLHLELSNEIRKMFAQNTGKLRTINRTVSAIADK